jgi:hypothetical protein
MELPSHACLDRLSSRDVEFLARVLCPSSLKEREGLGRLLTDREALVKVLDGDVVHAAVIDEVMPLTLSPELYFYVLVRRAMVQAQIEDAALAEYVAGMLARYAYGHGASPKGLPHPLESDIDYHLDVLQALDRASPYERFFLQLSCGNRFLFLTGLFPRFLRQRRDRRGAPGVRYYEDLARQAYLEASHHPLAGEFATRDLYEGLAQALRPTRRALNLLADQHLFLDA